MWGWIIRQYDDIRGNMKWAALLGLWWLFAHFGKQMLQLIPNIPYWLVSAIIVFFSLIAFVWVARLDHSRSPSQSQSPVQEKTIPGIPTLSALLGQNPNVEFDAKAFFARAYYSPVTAEAEKNIKIIAQNVSPDDKEAFYARFIGVGLVGYLHEVTWYTIYKSQISAIAELNTRGIIIPLAEVKKYYDKAVIDFPNTYARYSFEQWMNYMQSRMLVAKYPSDMVEIAHGGKDFLKFVAHAGWNINAKAN